MCSGPLMCTLAPPLKVIMKGISMLVVVVAVVVAMIDE